MAADTLQIGALAQLTGLSIDTIRFYEKQRLIQSPRRSDGGFRLFREEDAAALQFIRNAQDLGFSLDEIRELLSLRQHATKACPRMQHLLQTKLASVVDKIKKLQELESELRAALGKCETALRDTRARRNDACPVLEEISASGAKRNR